jgi:transcriptional regulator with XRE-family HTH domain
MEGKIEPLATVFGRRLKELRRRRGLTQEQLAKLVKLDYKFIGAIERGAKTSSFQTVEKLAKALGVEYYEFFISEPKLTASIQKEIAELAKVGHIDSSRIEEFLRGLRSLLKKLDRRDREG